MKGNARMPYSASSSISTIMAGLAGLAGPVGRVGLAAALVAGLATAPAGAEDSSAWTNPKPTAGDIVLPIAGNGQMVFVGVALPGKGMLGGGERMFMVGGAKEGGSPYEAPHMARIGSTFSRASGEMFLAVGKYEVTIGQFATVMGEGDIAAGLEHLRRVSAMEGLDKPGTESNGRILARPVHAVSQDEHKQFIARLNRWCLANKACFGAMERQLGRVGFFRLPTEVEWEYVARGGVEGMSVSNALPFPIAEADRFAFVGKGKRQFPFEIGKAEPHPRLPVYDIIGNVSELMSGPFTLDNGFGAVGGGVARGGDYRTPPDSLRLSLREEIRPFFFSSGTETWVETRPREVGIRLMVGAPVRDLSDRTFEAELAKEFRERYVGMATASAGPIDLAGNSLRTAKALGVLESGRKVKLEDAVGGDDPADYFSFTVPKFGNIRLELKPLIGEVALEYKHLSEPSPRVFTVGAGRTIQTSIPGQVPGPAHIKLYAAKGTATVRYEVAFSYEEQDRAGNTAREALDLGILEQRPVTMTDYVGPGDSVDVYRFETKRRDRISIRLIELGADANVELLSAKEDKLAQSVNPGRLAEQIDLADAAPGVYYIRVYSKDDRPGTYRLIAGLGVVDTVGNSPSDARDLGTMTAGVFEIQENLSATDQRDFYKVGLVGNSKLKLQLSRMSASAALYVYDARSRLVARSRASAEAQTLDLGLPGGDYHFEVRNETTASTGYHLTAEVRQVAEWGHEHLARPLTVGLAPASFDTALNDSAPERFASFELGSSSIVAIDMKLLRGDVKSDVDVYLRSEMGRAIAAGRKAGNAPERIVESLDPGRYVIQLVRDAGTDADVRLSISLQLRPDRPEPLGRVVSEHNDWQVQEIVRDGKKRCYAVTVATSISPSNWRGTLPYFFLSIEPGERSVLHRFDYARHYDVSKPFEAEVSNRSGRDTSIPMKVFGNEKGNGDLRTLERCGDSWCVSSSGLRGLTYGRELTITGTTRDNRPATIVYSLVGYQASVNAMNVACNNTSRTGSLVK